MIPRANTSPFTEYNPVLISGDIKRGVPPIKFLYSFGNIAIPKSAKTGLYSFIIIIFYSFKSK